MKIPKEFKLSIEESTIISKQEDYEKTFISVAQCGSQTCVCWFLKKYPNISQNSKDVALQEAAAIGHGWVVNILLANKANVHAGNDYALRLSVYKGKKI